MEVIEHRFGREAELAGAEIGVFRGANAAALLAYFPNLFLYLVDPYDPLIYREKNDQLSHASVDDHDMNREAAEAAVRPFSGRYSFIRRPSPAAAACVPSGLDFNFIDGDHSYHAVVDDLHAWHSKTTLTAGHDYNRADVERAVNEFAHLHSLTVNTGEHSVWWFEK